MTQTTKRIVVTFVVLSTIVGATAVFAGASMAGNHGNNANENSTADITVDFDEDCQGFTVESSKDISFVSINNETTHTYTKFEDGELQQQDEGNSANQSTFEWSGDEELKSIVVKSGTTMDVFECGDGGGETEPEDRPPECSDEDDNDDDGKTDHPADPGCETPDDDDERDPTGQQPGEGEELEVETHDATDVKDSSATLNGELTDLGEHDSADVFFEVREQGTADWTESPDEQLDSTGEFEADVEGLEPDTTYEFRAVAEADDERAEGNITTFTTEDDGAGGDGLTVTTHDATDVTNSSATLNGNLTDLGDNDNATVYFEWRENGTGEWTETDSEVRNEPGEFNATLQDLESNTTYEFRAIAESGDNQTEGEIESFTTAEDGDDGGDQVECSGEGDPIAIAIGGESSGDEEAENDDNVIDANVASDSDSESDCDLVDADVGQHNTSSEADDDTIDADVGTNNTAHSDDDDIDVDAGSTNVAVTDNDGLDVNLGSEDEAEESDEDDATIPPE